MIPKHIIKKVIAGGWKPKNATLGWDAHVVYEHDGIAWLNEAGYYQKTKYEQIVLDPEFWSALGKEMGWKKYLCGTYKHTDDACDEQFDTVGLIQCPSCRHIGAYPLPRQFFGDFMDLIYRKASKEEIDNFWKSL